MMRPLAARGFALVACIACLLLSASACMQQRVGNTKFWRAQQVTCVVASPRRRDAQRLAAAFVFVPHRRYMHNYKREPAVILGEATSANGLPAVLIKLQNTGAEVVVDYLHSLYALKDSYKPGDVVMRAMLK